MSYGACNRCGNALGECECPAAVEPRHTLDERLSGAVTLAVIPRKGHVSVRVCATWRSGHTEVWILPTGTVLDGISARRIERALNALIGDGVLRTTDMLAALGFQRMEKMP